MSIGDLNWSPTEKKVARAAFDKAYKREMTDIKNNLKKKAAAIKEDNEIWAIHDYLTKRIKNVNRKYDYRYSVPIQVFAQLMLDGYIKKEDLSGLREDKIELIMKFYSSEKYSTEFSLN
jgi:hypothetical protein